MVTPHSRVIHVCASGDGKALCGQRVRNTWRIVDGTATCAGCLAAARPTPDGEWEQQYLGRPEAAPDPPVAGNFLCNKRSMVTHRVMEVRDSGQPGQCYCRLDSGSTVLWTSDETKWKCIR